MFSGMTQRDIQVRDGDVVGGNKTAYTYIFSGPVSPLTHLSLEYENELIKCSSEIGACLPALQHYMRGIDSDQVQGLDEKLRDAARDEQVIEASRQKEIFAKHLHKHATSRAAQKIFLYLLGELLNKFKIYIVPKINAGMTNLEIDRAVYEEVFSPTLQSLDKNVLDLFHDEIWGMIYYLTGNCHIKWSRGC
jgi:hypothetical protein